MVARDFLGANGPRMFWLFTLARWACIPFCVLGAYVCYRWSKELYGRTAGFLALLLWCFSPNILAHGQMVTADMGATAVGATAAYLFWRWLRQPSCTAALAAGALLGLAQLAKTTWLILFGLWPLLWLVWQLSRCSELGARSKQMAQMALMFALAIYLLNLGYGFEGSLQRLGDYSFVSESLARSSEAQAVGKANRFADSWLASIPVPLPRNYVQGIDMQKADFESKMWSYLRGEWRLGGWWYYYLYGLAVKVPLGTWMLIFLAAVFWGRYASQWRDELTLLAPAGCVLILVSSQTGFNHHLRYVLPIAPFMFIFASKVARAVDERHTKVAVVAGAALVWAVVSSLCHYPHSLSYFNELVGGPKGGPRHLLDSNIDWGQDLPGLRRWQDDHPEALPMTVTFFPPPWVIEPTLAGVEGEPPPIGPGAELDSVKTIRPAEMGPRPGWHAISVNRLYHQTREYAYFQRFTPCDMVGYSIYIYHISLDEANRVRAELGLPLLSESDVAEGGAP